MAEKEQKLPDLDKPLEKPLSDLANTIAGSSEPIGVKGSTVSTKEMVIAFGALLAAAVVFVVIKNYVSKMLVSSYRKSPRSAEMAGWGLFCILLLAVVTAVLGILDSQRFFSFLFLIPIGLAMLAAMVMFVMALVSRR